MTDHAILAAAEVIGAAVVLIFASVLGWYAWKVCKQ